MLTTANRKSIILALLTFTSLAGCTDPRAATEANLRPLAEQEIGEEKFCFDLGATFPLTETAAAHWPYWQTFVAMGLLAEKPVVQAVDFRSNSLSSNPKLGSLKFAVKQYDLTDLSRPYHTVDSGWGQAKSKLCFGKYEIVSSEPIGAPFKTPFGPEVVAFSTSIKLTDVPSWFEDNKDKLFSVAPSLKQEFEKAETGMKREFNFALAKDGWKSARDFKMSDLS